MGSKRKVLLIDDDIPFSMSTQILLEDTGDFEVRVENDSLKALETAKEFQPDLILLDIVMPGYDGGDIRLLLRGEPDLADIPVMIITALISDEETGNDSFVECREQIMFSKPISCELLVAEIEKRLALKS